MWSGIGRKKGMVVIGQRVKQRRLIGMGLLLVVVGLLPIVGLVIKVDWNAHKPDWLLVWEVKHPAMSLDIDAVETQLGERIGEPNMSIQRLVMIGRGLLGVAEMSTEAKDRDFWGKALLEMVDSGVIAQEDLRDAASAMLLVGKDENVMWRDEWGEILFTAHEANVLTDKQVDDWVDVLLSDVVMELPCEISVNHLEDVLVTRRHGIGKGQRQLRGWLGWWNGRSKYKWWWAQNHLYINGEKISLRRYGKTGGGIGQVGSGMCILNRYEKDLKRYFEKYGEGDVEIEVGYQANVFKGIQGLEREREVRYGPITVRLVDVELKAKALQDEDKATFVKENMKPTSQMRFRLGTSSQSGRVMYAPYTTKQQLEDKLAAYQAQHELAKGRAYEHHVDFVLACSENLKERYGQWEMYDDLFVWLKKRRGIPMCYQIILRIDGEEYEQDAYVQYHGSTSTQTGRTTDGRRYVLPNGVQSNVCDVILRPDAAKAYSYYYMNEILADEIVYENVNLILVSDEEMKRAKNEWVVLRDRAKRMLVNRGVFESMDALNAYDIKVRLEQE